MANRDEVIDRLYEAHKAAAESIAEFGVPDGEREEAVERALAAYLDLGPDPECEPAPSPPETPAAPTTTDDIRRALSPEPQNVEARFLLDAVSRALSGEDPGDFASSFPVVADAMGIASRCASAECARDDHRASLVQHEKDWHRLMLLIAEVTGEEDPAAAVDDGFDPWSALRKVAAPETPAVPLGVRPLPYEYRPRGDPAVTTRLSDSDLRDVEHALRLDVPPTLEQAKLMLAEVRASRSSTSGEALRAADRALHRLWAAIGDRLLAKGPLAKGYAHAVLREIEAARASIARALSPVESPGEERTTGGSTLPGAMRPEFVHAREVAVALSRVAAGDDPAQVEEDYGFPGGMLAHAHPDAMAGSTASPSGEAPERGDGEGRS